MIGSLAVLIAHTGCYTGLGSLDDPPLSAASEGAELDEAGAAEESGDGSGPGVDASDGATMSGPPVTASCDTPQASRAQPRRLTRAEYANAVRDLLDPSIEVTTLLSGDSTSGPFATNHGSPASVASVEKYLLAAEEVADAAAERLDTILPCSVEEPSESCAQAFVDTFARRAYRGALDTTAADGLMESFRSTSSAEGFESGIRIIIEKVLQSPYFLYHIEVSEPGDDAGEIRPLTGVSLASKMAAFIWESVPDEELLLAAESGELSTAEGVRAQALRMMDDERATESFVSFIDQWFGLSELPHVQKDEGTFPNFDHAMAQAMRDETGAFVRWMIDTDQFNLDEFLTSSHAFPGEGLASFYGVEPSPLLDPLVLESKQRYGILTFPSFTALFSHTAETSVVRRGAFIRDHLLCQPLPVPPANVDTTLPEVADGVSERERLRLHAEDPACAPCHSLIDDLGFALETFDGIGQYREESRGVPIDTSGTLVGTSSGGAFDDLEGLVARLLDSEETSACAVSQWMRFAQRRLHSEHDLCSQQELVENFVAADRDFKSLVLSIVESTAFRFHNPNLEHQGASQ